LATTTKSLEQQIKAAEEKLARLKALKDGAALSKTSPGMQELLAALENVCTQNKCKIIDVVKSISKIKRVWYKVEVAARKPKKPREPKAS